MECKICQKYFEPPHWNSKCCSDACRREARRLSVKRYEQSDKYKEALQRWYKSPARAEIEKRYRSKPKTKALAVERSRAYKERNPQYVERHKQLQKERKDWLKPEARVKNRIATAKYKKTPKGRWQSKTYKYRLRNNQSGKIDIKQWEQKLIECEGRCMNCGTKENITIDHIITLSKGGTNLIDNLQPLCRSCNCSKGNKI